MVQIIGNVIIVKVYFYIIACIYILLLYYSISWLRRTSCLLTLRGQGWGRHENSSEIDFLVVSDRIRGDRYIYQMLLVP